MDAGDGLVSRAATVLAAGGYSDVAILEGGVEGCRAAGFQLFQGVNVPSKAFGEFVELACHTPHLPPDELKARLDRGDDLVVLDSRPFDEYRLMNIPSAISCPSQELLYRLRDVVPSPRTTVVVNCAGRTRSIVGAQSLINAGVPNPVVALQDGAMGWQLKGYPLEHKQSRRAPKASPEHRDDALSRADRIAARAGVKIIDWETFRSWRSDSTRTLYIFDVRPMEEYLVSHLDGAVPVEGVQLVQKTDNHVAVWSARIVITDDNGIRARITAAWLTQMGFDDVTVLSGSPPEEALASGPYKPGLLCDPPSSATISPAELAEALHGNTVTVIDFSRSLAFKAAHIPGAWFAIRARLSASLPRIRRKDRIVVSSEDGVLARFAAADVRAHLRRPIEVLDGGNRAWAAEKLPLETGLTNMADAPEDAFWRPYELDKAQESEMEKYLSWEQGLVDQVNRDGSARFRPLTPDAIWKRDREA